MIYEGEKYCLAEYGIDESVKKIFEIKSNVEKVETLDMQDFDNKISIIEACNTILDTYNSLNELAELVDIAKNKIIGIDNEFRLQYYNTLQDKGYNLEYGFDDLFSYLTRPFIKFDDEELKKYIDNYIKKNPELREVANSNPVILESNLEELARWYISNVPTYWGNRGQSNPRKYYQTPYGNKARGDDCTEFTGLYMSYVCGKELPETSSYGMIDPNGKWAQEASKYGWKAYTTDEIGLLRPGDVLVANSGSTIQNGNETITSSEGNHAEVYLDNNETFGWGKVQDAYPTKRTIEAVDVNGKTHYKDTDHDYITVYRYEGKIKSGDTILRNE